MIQVASSPKKLPFKEAIAHTNQKGSWARHTYYDLPADVHERAFMVAGLAKEDVLADIQKAVNKAIAEGQTLRDFQKDFEKIVADRWDPNGGVAWRARVIWETNMRTSYAAGRYKQMKDMAESNPFWMYCHGDSMKPRLEHLELDRMVLRHDDPWWDKNYPPNGWGCQCYVRCLTEGEVRRGGYSVVSGDSLPDAATDPRWQHAHGMHTTYNPNREPRGLPTQKDPDFEWKSLEEYTKGNKSLEPVKEDEYSPSAGKMPDTNQRPDLQAKNGEDLGKELKLPEKIYELPKEEQREMAVELVKKKLLGGADRAVFDIKCGSHNAKIAIGAESLVGHFVEKDVRRIAFLGYLPDLLKPQEVWSNWLVKVDKKTGKRPRRSPLVIRHTAVTRINHPDYKGVALVYQNNGQGEMAAWTFYPLKGERNIRATRKGMRIAKT